jgi:hypothetical protein
MKCFIIALILFITATFGAYAEKMVTLPESELKEYLDRMEADRATIKTLTAENYQLKLDKMNLVAEAATWKLRDDKQMGFYLGGAIGYPFPSGEVMALYKFRKWGVVGTGGYYGKAPAINLGVMVKAK